MSPATILIVDDDAHIRDVVRFALEKADWQVCEAQNGVEAIEQVQRHKPDLLVLDIMMPEMDGFETCRAVRKTSEVPILFLSSKTDEVDRIVGLELGGDDYLTKPFSPRELVARIRVMLKWLERSKHAEPQTTTVFTQGGVRLDATTYQVHWKETAVVLTATEFALLETFLSHPNQVFTRDALIERDTFRDMVTDRTVDSHIRRLRKKFTSAGCDTLIETVVGVGYKLGHCQ